MSRLLLYWRSDSTEWAKALLPELLKLIDSGESFRTCSPTDDDDAYWGNVYIVQFTALMGDPVNLYHPVLRCASAVFQSPARVSYLFSTTESHSEFHSCATVAYGLAHRSKDAGLPDIDYTGDKRSYNKACRGELLSVSADNNVDTIAADLRAEFETSMSRAANENRLFHQQVIVDDLRALPYEEYLKTDHWQTLRSQALSHAGYRCQVCNFPDRLHVHHRTYARRGCERLEDLTVLCDGCHKLFHQRGKLARGG